MQMSPYLNFKGQCREAMTFYAELLGGKIEMLMTHGESPMGHDMPDFKDKIMHAAVLLPGDQRLLGSDAPLQYFEKPAGFAVSVTVDTPEEAERIFPALAEGGKVTMELQQTFWAPRFGMVTDRFGIPWMVNCAPQQ
jgi:PhnB protein